MGIQKPKCNILVTQVIAFVVINDLQKILKGHMKKNVIYLLKSLTACASKPTIFDSTKKGAISSYAIGR